LSEDERVRVLAEVVLTGRGGDVEGVREEAGWANVKCRRARDVISHVRCYDGCTKWKSRKFKCRHEPVPSR
jgi:hypothetical protein